MKFCEYCGEPVSDDDYEMVGGRRLYMCGSVECTQEASADDQVAYEEAVEDFNVGWGR